MKKQIQKISSIKGMNEIFERYPHYDHIIQRSALKVLQPKYGYKPVLLNTLERAETFSRTLGVSSDIVQKEMYSFED